MTLTRALLLHMHHPFPHIAVCRLLLLHHTRPGWHCGPPPDSRRPPTISSLRMGALWPVSVATHLDDARDHTCRHEQATEGRSGHKNEVVGTG